MVAMLCDRAFRLMDLTDNELAKLHIPAYGRWPIAIRSPMKWSFKFFSLLSKFPSARAPLFNFLNNSVGAGTISMFTTRNSGARMPGGGGFARCQRQSAQEC